ncbi:hypothetical protein [Stagnihabitans tardus]|uniref:Uncharacterized protein n=1 Tax=Stagnihabitans tardus TaxID=2699202 RepID=A0AAE4YBQ2_9RHOB|nr:hypothetical protein [Stagnihabitans tardus]NBZ89742.1 hypothetical protein [Stagnihabitans tardus]
MGKPTPGLAPMLLGVLAVAGLLAVPDTALAKANCFAVDGSVQLCPDTDAWVGKYEAKSGHLMLYTWGLEVEVFRFLPVENKTNMDRTDHALYVIGAQRGWRGAAHRLSPRQETLAPFPPGTRFYSRIDTIAAVPLVQSTLVLLMRPLDDHYDPPRDWATLAPLLSDLRFAGGEGLLTDKDTTDGQ